MCRGNADESTGGSGIQGGPENHRCGSGEKKFGGAPVIGTQKINKKTFPAEIDTGKAFWAGGVCSFSGLPLFLEGIGRLAVDLFKHIYKVGIVIIT